MQGPPPQTALTGLVQHSPVTQAPPQQRSPAAHWTSEVQAEQRKSVQTAPASHSEVWQQSPWAQRPPQQRASAPHSRSCRQSRQPSRLHTWPAAQSAASQAEPWPPSGPGSGLQLQPCKASKADPNRSRNGAEPA